ncbi:MAG: hypothetical protein ABI835_15835 [Chloroflexota bacterium]
MAKKRGANQPVVADEPVRPEEQFSLDQAESVVAPPSTRQRAGSGSGSSGGSAKSYGARSARERRAVRSTSTNPRKDAPRRERHHDGLRAEIVSELLSHPTITVTEDELRRDYSYVLTDLRSMAILSAGLIVFLVVLAQVLPK